MLGWMMKRGDAAPDNVDAGDTTQLDMPDTPAPVFAARAIKSAIFGTPKEEPRTRQPRQPKASTTNDEGSRTPNSKPQGILLTPGTGAARLKRVSFGNHVDANASSKKDDANLNGGGTHKRTRLNEALEKARQKKISTTNKKLAEQKKPPSDDEWEEEDIDGEDDHCNHDITLDLNEPHSQSGRYWKEEFENYHKDAKAEMEKLLKYKQLAKSYARQKDAEAIDLAEQLKDEQQKVTDMEKKIAENASEILSRHKDAPEEASPELVAKLTKQTALAVQYKQRVQDLEDHLEAFLQEKQDSADSNGNRRAGLSTTSPRTQATLFETQRELRKARSQLKEIDALREQVSTLKDQLKTAEKRAAKAEDSVSSAKAEEASKVTALRAQLREAKEDSRRKDDEISQLKSDFESHKKETEAREAEKNAVLARAQTKIADLKKEVKTLKTTAVSNNDSKRNHEEEQKIQDLEDNELRPQEPIGTFGRKHRSLGEIPGSKDEQQNLRQKYHEDDTDMISVRTTSPLKTMSGALGVVPELPRPRWQEFVSRSPRNRAHLSESVLKNLENAGVASVKDEAKLRSSKVDAAPSAAKPLRQRLKSQGKALDRDELRSRFVRLDESESESEKPDHDVKPSQSAKGKLPADRRAAALARIEQRRNEKLKERARQGLDKENVHP